MTTFRKQIVAAVSASVMFLSMAAPVFAETTIVISGNGANSDSKSDVQFTGDTTVTQTNQASISNNIDADADTGKNDANQNTGGSVLVKTGDATTGVSVENVVNSNQASVDCCTAGDTDIEISGNGADTKNDVKLKNDADVSLYQTNEADIYNRVDADADTGKNDANQNTGGDVEVRTGDASTWVGVSNTANANWAQIGDGGQGSLSARILGNGFNSDNKIDLDLDNDTTLVQTNLADITNYIYADADTGKNDANQNTGGSVLVDTGDAETGVEVDNLVNFNWADVDCGGCVLDLLAKVAGNGADTKNEIKLKLDNDLEVYQTNVCGDEGRPWFELWDYQGYEEDCSTRVDADADTGSNDANQNTGDPEGDPSVLTGDSASFVEVSNSGNVNSYGVGGGEWPDFDFEFNLSLNLNDLLSLLDLI
ncbi:MAG: Uncharacterized protein G01um101416_205 [Microgenomates group bacterium Gr01-1014_16]|nr:MAG: Uncharacterized protein G01um101416_205 [Microgenomates group bacterium Gr01-1014_16]